MTHNYKTLPEAGDLEGRCVLLRLDLNVPIKDGKVVDDFRIIRALPTLEFLREKGAKIIIVSHIEGKTKTLRPVYEYLNALFPIKSFVEHYVGVPVPENITSLHSREAVLCENLRQYEGEKKNDEAFSRKLSSLAELYVNEAFSASHRPHASIIGLPRYLPGYAGLLFDEEVKNLSEAFTPLRPAFFILGGAKFDTKLPLLQKFLRFYEYVFVGGALANDVFKARGLEVGGSKVSEGNLPSDDVISQKNFFVPIDVVVKSERGVFVKKPEEVGADEIIMDAGPATVEFLKDYIRRSKFVLWNGPLGNYESGFKATTEELANYIVENSIRSILGGGDTLAAIASLNVIDKIDFVSTAGGAMLDFLGNETLPGLEALEGR